MIKLIDMLTPASYELQIFNALTLVDTGENVIASGFKANDDLGGTQQPSWPWPKPFWA
jgi:hypothetical protein